jgi:hypothetical protein
VKYAPHRFAEYPPTASLQKSHGVGPAAFALATPANSPARLIVVTDTASLWMVLRFISDLLRFPDRRSRSTRQRSNGGLEAR